MAEVTSLGAERAIDSDIVRIEAEGTDARSGRRPRPTRPRRSWSTDYQPTDDRPAHAGGSRRPRAGRGRRRRRRRHGHRPRHAGSRSCWRRRVLALILAGAAAAARPEAQPGPRPREPDPHRDRRPRAWRSCRPCASSAPATSASSSCCGPARPRSSRPSTCCGRGSEILLPDTKPRRRGLVVGSPRGPHDHRDGPRA